MRRTITVLFLLFSASAARAVPVVPNFTQGAMTSRTESSSQVTETINSINYNTGYQYVITGTNMSHDGDTISAPSVTAGNHTIEAVSYTHLTLPTISSV